ncbi:3-deoxy-7-phosphoheptulonate synthase [Treponema primitia ZAS-2]|uniref:Prephenate dehydratase n=1 Tax=Treponema primitia (strain ATCC BAA-887 / DSM 12427 / ZAS-2) TaxID=545694 RepID=F5YI34_TREPZ|nr:3-deoxy-7-phosphoheptulonate synthase [Treponema primitia]AEF85210.1 3-deoxy-7-phosphoheptulonate synthase [Treponema primitia ZAS-2]
MIVVLSKGVSQHDKEMVRIYLKDRGFAVRDQVLGDDEVIGGTGKGVVDLRELGLLPGVERVAATSKPYELASRESKPGNTIVTVGTGTSQVKIGGSRISVIAGPCAVESRDQIMETAARVRESGAVMLRGGAYKPRSSPYAFQGLGMQGLEFMKAAGEANGMPIVTEVVSPEFAGQMKDLTDMFQIGARNMQNFELLKKVGSLGKPVLLKRGPSATIEEWLLSAEYLLAAGTRDVVLCERGIRTFETYTRNTLDISAISVVKGLSHLPVIVDPSHAVGIRAMISSAALAAVAAGADGLTVEVHPRPDEALSDGPQSLYPEQFERLMRDIEALAPVVGKELLRTPRPSAGNVLKVSGKSGASATEAVSPSNLPIAFSGESGAYAEQALMRAFGEEAPRLQAASFRGVFDAVLEGAAGFGVVPVENSLAGSVHENYDLFLRYPDIAMVGELKLRIVHCLIADEKASIENISIVRSHPQGFAQCRDFLDKYPAWQLEACNDTATAVASIAREGATKVAAIAGEAAAKAHGLRVLKAGIETNPLNYTRFVIISRRNGSNLAPIPPSLGSDKPNKASLVFSVPDESGALFSCLKIISDRGLNLSKLESRPIQGQPWEYQFYVDVTIPSTEDTFAGAVEELRTRTENFYFLGEYRASL